MDGTGQSKSDVTDETESSSSASRPATNRSSSTSSKGDFVFTDDIDSSINRNGVPVSGSNRKGKQMRQQGLYRFFPTVRPAPLSKPLNGIQEPISVSGRQIGARRYEDGLDSKSFDKKRDRISGGAPPDDATSSYPNKKPRLTEELETCDNHLRKSLRMRGGNAPSENVIPGIQMICNRKDTESNDVFVAGLNARLGADGTCDEIVHVTENKLVDAQELISQKPEDDTTIVEICVTDSPQKNDAGAADGQCVLEDESGSNAAGRCTALADTEVTVAEAGMMTTHAHSDVSSINSPEYEQVEATTPPCTISVHVGEDGPACRTRASTKRLSSVNIISEHFLVPDERNTPRIMAEEQGGMDADNVECLFDSDDGDSDSHGTVEMASDVKASEPHDAPKDNKIEEKNGRRGVTLDSSWKAIFSRPSRTSTDSSEKASDRSSRGATKSARLTKGKSAGVTGEKAVKKNRIDRGALESVNGCRSSARLKEQKVKNSPTEPKSTRRTKVPVIQVGSEGAEAIRAERLQRRKQQQEKEREMRLHQLHQRLSIARLNQRWIAGLLAKEGGSWDSPCDCVSSDSTEHREAIRQLCERAAAGRIRPARGHLTVFLKRPFVFFTERALRSKLEAMGILTTSCKRRASCTVTNLYGCWNSLGSGTCDADEGDTVNVVDSTNDGVVSEIEVMKAVGMSIENETKRYDPIDPVTTTPIWTIVRQILSDPPVSVDRSVYATLPHLRELWGGSFRPTCVGEIAGHDEACITLYRLLKDAARGRSQAEKAFTEPSGDHDVNRKKSGKSQKETRSKIIVVITPRSCGGRLLVELVALACGFATAEEDKLREAKNIQGFMKSYCLGSATTQSYNKIQEGSPGCSVNAGRNFGSPSVSAGTGAILATDSHSGAADEPSSLAHMSVYDFWSLTRRDHGRLLMRRRAIPSCRPPPPSNFISETAVAAAAQAAATAYTPDVCIASWRPGEDASAARAAVEAALEESFRSAYKGCGSDGEDEPDEWRKYATVVELEKPPRESLVQRLLAVGNAALGVPIDRRFLEVLMDASGGDDDDMPSTSAVLNGLHIVSRTHPHLRALHRRANYEMEQKIPQVVRSSTHGIGGSDGAGEAGGDEAKQVSNDIHAIIQNHDVQPVDVIYTAGGTDEARCDLGNGSSHSTVSQARWKIQYELLQHFVLPPLERPLLLPWGLAEASLFQSWRLQKQEWGQQLQHFASRNAEILDSLAAPFHAFDLLYSKFAYSWSVEAAADKQALEETRVQLVHRILEAYKCAAEVIWWEEACGPLADLAEGTGEQADAKQSKLGTSTGLGTSSRISNTAAPSKAGAISTADDPYNSSVRWNPIRVSISLPETSAEIVGELTLGTVAILQHGGLRGSFEHPDIGSPAATLQKEQLKALAQQQRQITKRRLLRLGEGPQRLMTLMQRMSAIGSRSIFFDSLINSERTSGCNTSVVDITEEDKKSDTDSVSTDNRSDSKPTDANSFDSKPTDDESFDSKPNGVESFDSTSDFKPYRGEPSDFTSNGAESSDSKRTGAESFASKPKFTASLDSQPDDADPFDSKSHDADPSDSKPHDADSFDSKPHDADPLDSKPHDADPLDSKPHDADAPDNLDAQSQNSYELSQLMEMLCGENPLSVLSFISVGTYLSSAENIRSLVYNEACRRAEGHGGTDEQKGQRNRPPVDPDTKLSRLLTLLEEDP